MLKILLLTLVLICVKAEARQQFRQAFKDCNVEGSITIYDKKNKKWIISDSIDANRQTSPASTFKIINLLTALETRVIKDENEVIKWTGQIPDTSFYGYRPEIYKDMSVKAAFKQSAGWVFIELAKRIGRKRYAEFLEKCNYSNQNLLHKGTDFWNIGPFAISPVNQVMFLRAVYEGQVPFSKQNVGILKSLFFTEQSGIFKISAKTGWTRMDGKDIGWWVGYAEVNENVFFFATRITKNRNVRNHRFGECRKLITRKILKEINAIQGNHKR